MPKRIAVLEAPEGALADLVSTLRASAGDATEVDVPRSIAELVASHTRQPLDLVLLDYLHGDGARNGREALIAVATVMPDVIVLDVRMPEMNGMEFLQVIRSYLRWSNLPVILLTAYPDDLPLERAHELGVKMIFVKPNFRLDELLECVNRLAADPAARCEGPRAAGA